MASVSPAPIPESKRSLDLGMSNTTIDRFMLGLVIAGAVVLALLVNGG